MVKFSRIGLEHYAKEIALIEQIASSMGWDPMNKWEITYKGEKVHVKKKILPILLYLTKEHCAFCDYKLEPDNYDVSIEHFRPKGISKFKHLGYNWKNLYPSCSKCTAEKRDKFDDLLLCPDDPSYDFSKYFWVNGEGGVEPFLNNQCAKITIQIYNLNRPGLKTQRKKWIRIYPHLKHNEIENLESFPYRFLQNININADIIDEFLNKN